MKRSLFTAISLIWGFPMTIVGFIVAFCLICMGYKPKKFGWGYCFEVGRSWGGLNLGIIFIVSKGSSDRLKKHEFGHALQNCIWGPLTPFVIAIPSAIRYWFREFQSYKGKQLKPYDSIWFEEQATRWGTTFIDSLEVNNYENN